MVYISGLSSRDGISENSRVWSSVPRTGRRIAKLDKARRIRKQQDRCPRYTSWTDFGLEWVAKQAGHAFSILLSESRPSLAILQTSLQAKGSALVGSGGGGDDDDGDDSDTDDYGSSDGGGGKPDGGGFGAGGAGGSRPPGGGDEDSDDDDDDDDKHRKKDARESGEDDVTTDEDSEDDYGQVDKAGSTGMPRAQEVPGSSISAATHDYHSDSSDDRPLGELVNDPKSLQKALRAQERKRHFALAHLALEGKSSSNGCERASSSSSNRRAAANPTLLPHAAASVNPDDLAQRLAKVQGRRERAHPGNSRPIERSQTVARHEAGAEAERKHAQGNALLRSRSVRQSPDERYQHPGLKARTPSEAALRARAMAPAMSQTQSSGSPNLPSSSKMPGLPPNAVATVVAAQKAMAQAQVNPTPTSIAQAQALAASATAALTSAAAHVKRPGSSPLSPTFGEPTIHAASSQGSENKARSESRDGAPTSGQITAPSGIANAGILPKLRARASSRAHGPLVINTSAAPPIPDLPRLATPLQDAAPGSASPRTSHPATFGAQAPAAVASQSGRPSEDRHRGAAGLRMSMDHQSSNSTYDDPHSGPGRAATAFQQGNMPATSAEPRLQYKVFILSRQRASVAEVPLSARARDLVLDVVARENLPMDDTKGGWVAFDCSLQLGIERPLREYEMVNEVVSVRADLNTDYFLLKRTELSPYLSIRCLPTSSPVLAGWVYVQDRKKKWNKRWIELRENCLYQAKNEKGKEEAPICQISTFDVYLVDPSTIKMPKANGFALRSQDKISMFEKPDQDYIHYFSLTDAAAHRDWVRAILNARTYVLKQEKAVLFQAEASRDDALPIQGAATAGGLSRKNTGRRPTGRSGAAEPNSAHAPSTPLIDSSSFAGPFAKGSLLADRAISDAKEALRGTPAGQITGAFNDLSLVDRNAARTAELKRREEAAERQRRMKTDGQPLIDLSKK